MQDSGLPSGMECMDECPEGCPVRLRLSLPELCPELCPESPDSLARKPFSTASGSCSSLSLSSSLFAEAPLCAAPAALSALLSCCASAACCASCSVPALEPSPSPSASSWSGSRLARSRALVCAQPLGSSPAYIIRPFRVHHTAWVLLGCTVESPLHHEAIWRRHKACVLPDCAVENPLHAPCLQSMRHEGQHTGLPALCSAVNPVTLTSVSVLQELCVMGHVFCP